MMDDARAEGFAEALTELCKRHGLMIWTGTYATPIMATPVAGDERFHYAVERCKIGSTVIIRRVLGESA
jgi:hypothetical protein